MTLQSPRGSRAPLALLLLLQLVSAACHKPAVVPSARPSPPAFDPAEIAARFDASIGEGCYLCLLSVIQEFESLPDDVRQAPVLQPVVARAALLLVMRVRELGIPVDDDLRFAEAFAAAHTDVVPAGALILDVVHALPWNAMGVGEEFALAERARNGLVSPSQRAAWKAALATEWPASDLAAYVYLSLLCGDRGNESELMGPKDAFPQSRLIRYRLATCPRRDETALRDLLAESARLVEIQYFLSQVDSLRRRYPAAERDLLDARHAIPHFTAASVMLAELELSGDNNAQALEIANGVLALVPAHWQAWLDKVKALSNLARFDDAIAAATHMIEGGRWLMGDAYYWRAWNEYQLDRADAAMADVQAAKDSEKSGRVFLLAGVVRMKQSRWSDAREEFLTSRNLDDSVCDVHFYLGHVDSQLVAWNEAAASFVGASRCYASAAQSLQAGIAVASRPPVDDWTTRQLEKLKRDLAGAIEQEHASIYNAAAMFANAGAAAEARPYATQAQTFPAYAERATALLATLK
jgi:tetratricopeptide (TPR) repeat protein